MTTLDPWGAVKIDNYSKLFDEFGISRFDDLLERIPNPHRYMRRHVIFGHRSYETVLDAMLTGKPFAALSGFMPSGKAHLGHKMVMEEIIWHQQQGGDVFLAIADMEAHAVRGKTWKECEDIGKDYILSAIALGLEPGAHIYFQSKSDIVKSLAFELGIKANFSELSAIYGFNGETNISHMVSALTQSADILHPQLKEFRGPKPVVIPVGADQDPHIRLTRGLAYKMNMFVFKHPSEFNDLSEIQCEKWFHLLGIKMKKLSPPGPDYEIPDENIGVECSTMDVYKNADVLAGLRENLCNKKGTEQHVKITVDDSSNVVVKIIKEFKRNDEIAVLIVEYDLSAVRKKHLSKLNKEMEHFQGFDKCLLVLDYRYFMFRSSILSTEWNDILQQYGESYKSLLGVILVTLKTAKDDVTVDSPVLQFIQNPHTPFQIPKQLESIKLTDQHYNIKPISIEVCGLAPELKFELSHEYLKKFGLDAEAIRVHTIKSSVRGKAAPKEALSEIARRTGGKLYEEHVDIVSSSSLYVAFKKALSETERRTGGKLYEKYVDVVFDSSLGVKPMIREVGLEHGSYAFMPPASTYHKFMTGLQGGKMSSSVPESYIALTDPPEEGAKKVMRAKTGGRVTLEEQKEIGGEPDVCTVYELLLYHLIEDDNELLEVYKDCVGGTRVCGKCKKHTAERMREFLKEHQEKREQARERLHEFGLRL